MDESLCLGVGELAATSIIMIHKFRFDENKQKQNQQQQPRRQ